MPGTYQVLKGHVFGGTTVLGIVFLIFCNALHCNARYLLSFLDILGDYLSEIYQARPKENL